MNFQFYVEKLQDSEKYKDFTKENKKAFLCSCFFTIDKEGEDNKQHFDFWNEEKFYSFQLEKNELVPVEVPETNQPEEVSLDLDLDFNDIENIIEQKMEEKNIKNKIQKFLYSLQKKDGKHYLIGTVFISGLGMLRIKICIENKELLDFEKKSFFDVLKISGKK